MNHSLYRTRFGELAISPEKIWSCNPKLLGFPDLSNFCLIHIANQGPFLWLQSLDNPLIAFLVCEDINFGLNYGFLSPDCGSFVSLVFVILPGSTQEELRTHELGPLQFCLETRQFRQWIIEQPKRCAAEVQAAPPTALLPSCIALAITDPSPSEAGLA